MGSFARVCSRFAIPLIEIPLGWREGKGKRKVLCFRSVTVYNGHMLLCSTDQKTLS
jgi:hypothetical protein